MPSAYPENLDDLPNPGAATSMSDPGFLHDVLHSDAHDAIEAVERHIGVRNSTTAGTVEQRLGDARTRLTTVEERTAQNHPHGPVTGGGGAALYGDGADGDLTLGTGNTTLDRDRYYRNLTVPSGATLNTNGYRLFVSDTLTLHGTVRAGALDAGVFSTNLRLGTKFTANTVGNGGDGGDGGANGVSGMNGAAPSPSISGTRGGAGGAGGGQTGGLGGLPTALTQQQGGPQVIASLPSALSGHHVGATPGRYFGGGGGGGGGGAANGTGGGGGGGGGVLVVAARRIVGNGVLSARGAHGGNATGTGAAGGGGGGGGGAATVITDEPITATIDVSGGLGGAGVAGGGAGANGPAGRAALIIARPT